MIPTLRPPSTIGSKCHASPTKLETRAFLHTPSIQLHCNRTEYSLARAPHEKKFPNGSINLFRRHGLISMTPWRSSIHHDPADPGNDPGCCASFSITTSTHSIPKNMAHPPESEREGPSLEMMLVEKNGGEGGGFYHIRIYLPVCDLAMCLYCQRSVRKRRKRNAAFEFPFHFLEPTMRLGYYTHRRSTTELTRVGSNLKAGKSDHTPCDIDTSHREGNV